MGVARIQREVGRGIARSVSHDKWTLIVGISADKDIPAILDELLPIAERVIVTRASNSRAAGLAALGSQVIKRGCETMPAATVAEALEIAQHEPAPIIVTGSLFTVADAREAWFKKIGLPLEKDE
jgi:dihydrofolate synthase/folylpolyglutamate synthase